MNTKLASLLLLSLVVLGTGPVHSRGRKRNKTKKRSSNPESDRGNEAPIGRFPYMCSLRVRGIRRHGCGATLIRKQWAITAAHCVDPNLYQSLGRSPIVYCGIHYFNYAESNQMFHVEETFIYGSWKGDVTKGFDIALLRLDRRAKFPRPRIDAPGISVPENPVFTALGWGRTETRDVAETLQLSENLTYVPKKECKRHHDSAMKRHMICAGSQGHDTCTGDSGGPLMIAHRPGDKLAAGNPKRDLIVGITSFGSSECDGRVPGVYTSIGYFSDWISFHIHNSTRPKAGRKKSKETESPTADWRKPLLSAREEKKLLEVTATVPVVKVQSCPALQKMIVAIDQDLQSKTASLLEKGIDPDSIYYNKRRHNDYMGTQSTLLHWAAFFDSSKSAKALLNYNADVDSVNDNRRTPLHIAVLFSSEKVAKVLLDGGAYIDSRDADHATPLLVATEIGDFKLAKILLEGGASTDVMNIRLDFPLHIAVSFRRFSIAELLLEHGADVESIEGRGFTPLHVACEESFFEAVELLLDHGADANSVSILGETPLLLAVKNNQEEIVKVLLRHGAHVNVADSNGMTPLHHAAFNGNLAIAKMCVEAGASKSATDGQGRTPLDVVCLFGRSSFSSGCSITLEQQLRDLVHP